MFGWNKSYNVCLEVKQNDIIETIFKELNEFPKSPWFKNVWYILK